MKKIMITLVAVFGLAVVATGFAATQPATHTASSLPPTGMFNAVTPPTGMFN